MKYNLTTELAASSSSPSTNQWKYDVFLSFRGADTRFNFVDHLYSSLVQWGIDTFRDDDELRRGGDISREIFEAIEKSRISVVIFSKNYASSTWCLDQLAKILECMKSQRQRVLPIYYDVDPSDVSKQTGPFREAFLAHGDRFKDDLNKVMRWRSALTEAAHLVGMFFNKEGYESRFIRKIIEEISRPLNRLYLTHEANYLVGMDSRMREMNDLLGVGVADVRMVGIGGLGGMGKTTLAKAVYNSVNHKFEGSCFLGNVRKKSEAPRGLVKLQKTLLHDILGVKISSITDADLGVDIIRTRLGHKRVLLIIDDVDQLKQLKCLAGSSSWFGVGSRIIITTRDQHLLRTGVDFIYQVKELEPDEAMELFHSKAFPTSRLRDDYQVLARRFVGYAQGNPLALTAAGSLLYGKGIDKWRSILERYERVAASNIQKILKIIKKEHDLQRRGLNEAESPEKVLEDEEDGLNEVGSLEMPEADDVDGDTVEWTFLIISFFLEILAAICDQFFSPGNTQFALTGMWLASGALFVCICELILKWKIGESSSPRLEMFPEIFGLICGISQWLSTIARFGCMLKGMENPFKVNLLPVIFLGCLVARKLIANIKRCKTENRIELTSIVHVPSNEPTPDEAQAKKGP
ncbi:hypothetical protein L3X38_043720 [Prunus dulcis]|uniref:TIR domain-containing protein n=1 Tax=Prunus dulcis TaxID=3755 RepID=A0AAD4YMR8_PRUDU|nr:hypothetical protein L3X38_043720 [Prunus dulcis]